MRIFCELLPRLGCGNVAVVGGPEGGARVQVTEYGMEVGGANFSLPCDASTARLVPDSLSCLTVAATGTTTFRVKLGREGREELPYLLPAPRPQYRGVTTPRVPAPPLQPGQLCVVVCRCGEEVGRLELGRVLPLPSLHYQAGSLDWFCCASKLTSPATATPRSQDLLYSAHSTAISIEHLRQSLSIKDRPLEKERLLGDGCVVIVWLLADQALQLSQQLQCGIEGRLGLLRPVRHRAG